MSSQKSYMLCAVHCAFVKIVWTREFVSKIVFTVFCGLCSTVPSGYRYTYVRSHHMCANVHPAFREHKKPKCSNIDTLFCTEQCWGSGSKVDPYSATLWIRICILNTFSEISARRKNNFVCFDFLEYIDAKKYTSMGHKSEHHILVFYDELIFQ